MKILVLTNLYPPYYLGGYELDCWDIIEGLKSRGHEITVITSTYGLESPCVEDGVHRVFRLMASEVSTAMYVNKLKRPFDYVKAQWLQAKVSRHNARVADQIIDQINPDVAYIWNMSDLTLSPLLPLFKRKVPCVYRLGERWAINYWRYYTGKGVWRSMLRRMLIGVKDPYSIFANGTYLANSNSLRDEHVSAGFPTNDIHTLYIGIRVPKDIPPLPDSDTFRMLYTGRLCEEKGVHVALKAMAELAQNEEVGPFTFDIVGPGSDDYVAQLKRDSESFALEGKVRFLGPVPREQLDQMRSDYHTLVFPSVWAEPFGMVLIEAMAAGLPVVGTRVGGSAEFLVDGENMLSFPPGDSHALAEVLERLMKDRTLLNKLRRCGRDTVEGLFDFEKLLDVHERYLLEAKAKSPSSSAVMGGRLG